MFNLTAIVIIGDLAIGCAPRVHRLVGGAPAMRCERPIQALYGMRGREPRDTVLAVARRPSGDRSCAQD
jgi:hypothetical protein